MTDYDTRVLLDNLFATCIGWRDDYALQCYNGRYRRAFAPITYQVLYQHVQQRTIGTYVIDQQNCCRFAVYDADGEYGLEELTYGIQWWLAEDGIPSYLERSRRGGHLWVFFAEPLPASLVRAWLLPYAFGQPVEFFPKQEAVTPTEPGSLVRVPFGVHLRSGERYPFVMLDSESGQEVPLVGSVVEGLQWLGSVGRAKPPSRLRSSSVFQAEAAPPSHTHTLPCPSGATVTSEPADIRSWCLRYDPLEVIGRYVPLTTRGLGHCPFGWHHDDGVDSHASFYVYRPEYPDLRCWYCHTWKQGGSLFDFFRYYYNLSARELWFRIKQGAQV
jgi:hypothetical protein